MASAIGIRTWDVAVIGAGVWGLAVARAARARGLSVIVLEAATVGAGASGGIVGALSPHVPERWNDKKQFQFRALLMGPDYWRRVEAASGLPTGHVPSGRLMPLPDAETRARAEERAAGASEHWGTAARWQVLGPDAAPGWLDPEAAPCGVVYETLSARLFPRAACAALAAAARAEGVVLRENLPIDRFEPGLLSTRDGPIPAKQIVVAAGVAGFRLLGIEKGRGVKGQAALLRAEAPEGAPLIYADGVYAVPQPGGMVAVGSTSENRYLHDETDAGLDPVIETARKLSPLLSDAVVVERWAGIRPRAPRPDPLMGPVPGQKGVFAALGGFKIGFGLAPLVGEVLADMLEGATPPLPEGFAAADQMSR